MKLTTLHGVGGLPYVELKNVPYKVVKDIGKVILIDLRELERLVALELLRQKVPLRGREVKFFRAILGMSMEKFAVGLGLTAASILKWERAADKRLAPINEVAVRAFVAEKLKVTLPGKFSSLLGTDESPIKLSLTWNHGSLRKNAA